MPQGYEKPKGRMLIYWGCGEHVGAGQPTVIDFSKLAAGQVRRAWRRWRIDAYIHSVARRWSAARARNRAHRFNVVELPGLTWFRRPSAPYIRGNASPTLLRR